MGDVRNGESVQDRAFVEQTTSHNAATGIAALLTCTLVSPLGVRTALVVVEIGQGWYGATFTPNADGIWSTEWAPVDTYTIFHKYKYFKVGGGEIALVLAAVGALNDISVADIEASAILAKEATFTNATYGLDKIKTDTGTIAADFDRHLSHLDFWSAKDDVIAITAAADQDYDLPDVTVPTLPTGLTIYRVELLFACMLIRDTSGSSNAIDEAGKIRVKKDGDASFDTDGVDAYVIADNMWAVDVTNVGRDRAGDGFVGNLDIKSKVDSADTYNLRLDSISADGGNLELHDVAVGLRIWFY